MLWLKSFHIIFVVSWFAGLFYLPRIFVNLAMCGNAKSPERDRLLLMAGKLFKFMTPIGGLALVLGFWLWLGYGFSGGWLHAKLLIVLFLVFYHFYCAHILNTFRAGINSKGDIWFRWFNEIPVLLLVIAVILVVVKPF